MTRIRRRSNVRGDRVLVDRSALLVALARRWEVVVFHSPEEPAAMCVKRVVGLPGESVQIPRGDVFINGAIARKHADAGRTSLQSHERCRVRTDQRRAIAGTASQFWPS